MIGIGGVSMSGIAEILKYWGFIVTGSDRTESDITRRCISRLSGNQRSKNSWYEDWKNDNTVRDRRY